MNLFNTCDSPGEESPEGVVLYDRVKMKNYDWIFFKSFARGYESKGTDSPDEMERETGYGS